MNAESREIQLTSHDLFALIPPTKRSFGFQSPKREKGFLENKKKKKKCAIFFFLHGKKLFWGGLVPYQNISPPHTPLKKKIIIKNKIKLYNRSFKNTKVHVQKKNTKGTENKEERNCETETQKTI